MFLILLLLFTIIPALEIFLLFSIGGEIGATNTFLIVILTGIVGAALAKTQGISILSKIQNKLNTGIMPTDHLLQGLLVFGGGLLLLTPGFITDILGLSMVTPGTRHIIATYLKYFISKAISKGNLNFSMSNNFNDFKSKNPQEPSNKSASSKIDSNTFETKYTKSNDS